MSLRIRLLPKRPLFIVGPNRSGTSVLKRIITSHPKVYGRSGNEEPIVHKVGELAYESKLSEFATYYQAEIGLAADRFDAQLRLTVMRWIFGRRNVKEEIKAFGSLYSLAIAKYWCAKCFPSFESYKGLRALYPDARFIYIFRDGASVVRSRLKYPEFADAGFEKNVDDWVTQVDDFSYALLQDDILVVRHEEMVQSPSSFLQKIWTYLDLFPYDPALNDLSSGLIQPLGYGHQKISVDSAKDFFNGRSCPFEDWTTRQVEYFVSKAALSMDLLSYPMNAKDSVSCYGGNGS